MTPRTARTAQFLNYGESAKRKPGRPTMRRRCHIPHNSDAGERGENRLFQKTGKIKVGSLRQFSRQGQDLANGAVRLLRRGDVWRWPGSGGSAGIGQRGMRTATAVLT